MYDKPTETNIRHKFVVPESSVPNAIGRRNDPNPVGASFRYTVPATASWLVDRIATNEESNLVAIKHPSRSRLLVATAPPPRARAFENMNRGVRRRLEPAVGTSKGPKRPLRNISTDRIIAEFLANARGSRKPLDHSSDTPWMTIVVGVPIGWD